MNPDLVYENFMKEIEEKEKFPPAFLDACKRGDLNAVISLSQTEYMKSYNNDAYAYSFQLACGEGHMEVAQYLLNHNKFNENQNKDHSIDLGFQMACLEGKIEMAKYLSSVLGEKANYNESYIWACKHGQLDVVKYLLTSKELLWHADINYEHGQGLSIACLQGHLEIVRYLLTSPELKETLDIHVREEESLLNACKNNHIHVVKYLLTSSELKEHANLHANDDAVFIQSIMLSDYELLNYFIFELNTPKSKFIEEHLKLMPNEKIENWFKLRDLNCQLNQELPSDKIISKKCKL